LFLTKDNRAIIGDDCHDAWQAISGREVFVKNGKYTLDGKRSALYATPEPRTAFALSTEGRKLMLFVVDGRQPNYSEGVSIVELAAIIIEHGGATALHIDGGGSSTLVRADETGEPIVVNSPIHGRHPPGRERPVANHLGVYAK
jgi:exopolysaccharide biosynthesis protein